MHKKYLSKNKIKTKNQINWIELNGWLVGINWNWIFCDKYDKYNDMLNKKKILKKRGIVSIMNLIIKLTCFIFVYLMETTTKNQIQI